MGESGRIEQRHVGPLPELRAGRMGGVADDRKPAAGGTLQRVMAIAGKRKLVEAVDLVGKGAAVGPEAGDPLLPRVEPRGPHLVRIVGLQAPEERRHFFSTRLGPADRQHADHHARFVVALQQRVLLETLRPPGERRPEGAVGERFRLGADR